jgi:hypothetical protein
MLLGMLALRILPLALLAACSASPKGKAKVTPASSPEDFGPLEYGAEFRDYTKVNKETFQSPTHGKRFVDIYVNEIGLEAYRGASNFPVGTIIVKESWESKDGAQSDVAGPTFVMVKREEGFAPEHEDWWYGFHWADVPESWASRLGSAQIYWRTPSRKVDYCWGCHEDYDREVGLPPSDMRDF